VGKYRGCRAFKYRDLASRPKREAAPLIYIHATSAPASDRANRRLIMIALTTAAMRADI
jgi:hypothetical protein